jgi:hypothetical protein
MESSEYTSKVEYLPLKVHDQDMFADGVAYYTDVEVIHRDAALSEQEKDLVIKNN